jgi:hypothetical protein
MIEIFNIIVIFFIFSLTLVAPINLRRIKIKKLNLINHASFNLVINCNILLVLSFLPISISLATKGFLFIYVILFLKYYFKELKFNNFRKIIKTIFPYILIFFILSISIATKLELGWDAKYFYYIKMLYYDNGQFFSSLSGFDENKWHPHFGSYLWAFFTNTSALNLEYVGRLYYLFIFIFMFIFVILKDLKIFELSNFIILFLLMSLFYQYERFSGLQEILIFVFLGIAAKYLYLIEIEKKNEFYLYVVFIANILVWIKSEGLVYSLILALLLVSLKNLPKNNKMLAFWLIIFSILAKSLIHFFFEFNLNSQPFYNLEYIISLKFNEILSVFLNLTPWLLFYISNNLFYLLALFILIIFRYSKIEKDYLKLIFIYLILNIGFIYSAYIFREMELITSIRTTLERIVFSSSGFYVFFVFYYIKKQLSKYNKKLF